MATTSKKQFLTEEIQGILANLNADTPAKFGLMTAQHMIEHLIWVTKTSVKRYGEPADAPTEGQQRFKKFITNGAKFRYRPSDKTKADLPALKMPSLEAAIAELPNAVSRFYNHYETNPGFKCYNAFQGELSFEELEVLHHSHFRYHFSQFGLLEY